jgi:glyoxylase-like metal-dependent hydrolase (beta-lactamase superfamily II)
LAFVEVGDYRITLVRAGRYLWDGGAMFGVVPKTLWSNFHAADEFNRIPCGLNCYVIDDGRKRILVETGMGVRHDERAIERGGLQGAPLLRESLAREGFEPESISTVVNTHLHWDHAGGNTLDENGRAVPMLPNARYVTQRGELEHARSRHPRDSVSYRLPNYEPLVESGCLDLIEGEHTIAPGVELRVAPGHNRDMMIVVVRSGIDVWCHLADLVMYAAQVTPTWVSGFDLFPLEAIDNRTSILGQAAREGWWCSFAHDPNIAFAKIETQGGKWRIHQSLD